MMYFSLPTLASKCHFCQSRLRIRDLATAFRNRLQKASSSSLLGKASEGEEAATPGQPVAQARFWKFPFRQFTLENHRLPLARRNHPAESGTLTFR